MVERVTAAGARQFNTAQLGAIDLLFLPQGMQTPVFARASERRWWHEASAPPGAD